MMYAALFGFALAAGWAASIHSGGRAESETMCLLSMVWGGTLVANLVTGSPSPFVYYAFLDVAAVIWLLVHQRKNWQWIPGLIFAGMMMMHTVFWFNSTGGLSAYPRLYQDILAGLGYLQIMSVGWAIYERIQRRSGKVSGFGHWGLSDNWVFLLNLRRTYNVGS